MMELALVVFDYLTMFMYFDLLYRLFIPRVKFSYLFLSFLIIIVLGMGSLNLYVLPMQATFIRMVLPQIVIFLWSCICFEDSVGFKIFGCLCEIIITYTVEMVCMLLYFLFTKERMIELLNDPIILLILRMGTLMANLLAYEIVIRTIRKYKISQIPFFSIILPILFLTFFIGNCIQGLAVYHDIAEWIVTTIVTYLIVGVLLIWLLYGIYVEYQKKSKFILHTEIEKQYQTLLDDYLSISDTQQLQKYLRHDIANHLKILEDVKKESKKER